MSDVTKEPPRAHIRITYTGPVYPHWEIVGDYGDPDLIDEFARRERMVLTIAPEGTRSRVTDWKRGFHHVARGAGVPIVPVALDFRRRRVVFGEAVVVTDDYVADMVRIKPFFRAEMAKHPANYDDSLPAIDDASSPASGSQAAGSSPNESRSST